MKDRPYASAEQYERWFIRDCARCGRRACKAANWEGLICRTCCDRAARTYGTCPGCGTHRLLPGRDGSTPICRDCASITRDFHCARCGTEGLLLRGRLCERCSLSDRLAAALDDGTGRINLDLRPLFDGLCAIPTPRTGLN